MAQSTQSLSFNGSTGKVTIASAAAVGGSSTYSISCWFKSSASPGNDMCFYGEGNTGSDSQFVKLALESGFSYALVFVHRDNVDTISVTRGSTTGLNDGAWHHVMAVRVSGAWTLYLDGTSNGTGSTTVGTTTINDVRLGCLERTSAINFFNGSIDDVATWQGADKSTSAAGIAAGSTDVSTLSPTGLWRIEEGTGTTTSDTSGNGHDGTLVGGVTWSSSVPSPLAGGGGTTYTRLVTDNLGGQEGGLSRLASYFRQPADSLGGSDTFTRKAPSFRVSVDSIGESDAASRLAACYRVQPDNLGLTDTAARKATSFRIAPDSLGLSDTAVRLAASFRLVTDNLGLHDAAFIGGAVRIIAVLDSIGVSDSAARTAAALRALMDAAGFADAVQRATAAMRSLADAAGAQDAAARSAACYRVTVDTLGLHDAALMSGTVIISLPIARFAADYGYQVNVGADYPFLVSVAEDVPG